MEHHRNNDNDKLISDNKHFLFTITAVNSVKNKILFFTFQQ